MPLFKVGDYVERVGTLAPQYTKLGQVVRVIPHPELPEHLTEYEVNFGFAVVTFYQSQLRPAQEDPPSRYDLHPLG